MARLGAWLGAWLSFSLGTRRWPKLGSGLEWPVTRVEGGLVTRLETSEETRLVARLAHRQQAVIEASSFLKLG